MTHASGLSAALDEQIRELWRLLHNSRQSRTYAYANRLPSASHYYAVQVEMYTYALRTLLGIRRAGKGKAAQPVSTDEIMERR